MGHRISAVILQGPFDKERADDFDLKPFALPGGLTLLPLDASYVDHWAERLGLDGHPPDFPLLTSDVLRHILHGVAGDALYAVIQTNYIGGIGGQTAAVYRGAVEVMAPEQSGGEPINKALRLLGVTASQGMDEFDTVGLGNYRDFYDLFAKYRSSG